MRVTMYITRAEKKLIEYIEKKKHILFFIVVTVLGIYVRYAGRKMDSGDMVACLIPWLDIYKQQGHLKVLKEQIGDYNVLYQTCLAFMSYFKMNSKYIIKLFSCIFEYLLAFSSAWMLSGVLKKKKFGCFFNIVYTTILFLPTVVLNGAYWGQCDAIYSFFIVMALFYLWKEKYLAAFIFLGIAFGFKFQAVFIIPFIICYYFYKKKFSALMFLVSVLVFWATGIVAFINGRPIMEPFKIYAQQTSTYQSMYLNVSSVWVLLGNDYSNLKTFSVILTIILCGIGLYVILHKLKKMDTIEQYFNTVVWFFWLCILFLPAMHERYTFTLEILLVYLCFINTKYIKYAITSVTLSIIAYGAYLFGNGGLDKWFVIVYLAAFFHYTYTIVEQDKEDMVLEK